MGILIAWQVIFTAELKRAEGPGSSKRKRGAADGELAGKRPHASHHGITGPVVANPPTGGDCPWPLIWMGSSSG